jgi:hypothetical protein
MELLVHILIFIIILFLYIHITQQYKYSEDLEIYEMDYTDNIHLQEVCNLKQPILFEYKNIYPEFFDNITPEILSHKYGPYDINVKDINDYWTNERDTVDYMILPFQSAETLINSDINSKYFIENNQYFIEDTGLTKSFINNDQYIKPQFTVQTIYDIQLGSKGTVTPLRFHTNNRHFVCVNSGKISIKMAPWKSSKFLHTYKDYETYEFRSPINVWKPQRKYFNDMDKIKWLDIEVDAGYIVYIPSYWWYSIKYSDEPNTILTSFTYNNIPNILSNTRDIGLYYLQQNNIKHRMTKPIFEVSDDIEYTDNGIDIDIDEDAGEIKKKDDMTIIGENNMDSQIANIN